MVRLQVIFVLLTVAIRFPNVHAQHQQNIVCEDDFLLNSNTWEQKSMSPVILLLHQCDADQGMYANLAKILFNSGFHVITFDYRGLGKSVSPEFNIEEAQNRSEAWNKLALHNKSDLDAVMSFVKKKFSSNATSISILGASCGGSKVLYLAEQYHSEIKAIGFLSSRMSPTVTEKIKKMADKPALFIAAKGDRRAYEAARSGMEYSTATDSKIIVYKGSDHAKALFLRDSQLEETIGAWYAEVIQKR